MSSFNVELLDTSCKILDSTSIKTKLCLLIKTWRISNYLFVIDQNIGIPAKRYSWVRITVWSKWGGEDFLIIVWCWGDDTSVWKYWVVFETVAPVDPSLVKLSWTECLEAVDRGTNKDGTSYLDIGFGCTDQASISGKSKTTQHS